METSSGGRIARIYSVLGAVLLMSACIEGGPIAEPNTTVISTCNTGWELCPTTSLCVLSVCKDIDYSNVPYNRLLCQYGQVPCKEAGGACMWPCPKPSNMNNPSSPMQPQCGIGKILCESTMTCTTSEECNVGQVGSVPSCQFGSTFCVSKGGCVFGGCDGNPAVAPNTATDLKSCPVGTEYCLDVGKCVLVGQCNNSQAASQGASCQATEEFCLGTGSCRPKGMCKDAGLTQGSSGKGTCRSDHEFCLALGACILKGFCQYLTPDSQTDPNAVLCPAGQVFCLDKNTCMPKGLCSSPNPQSLPMLPRCIPSQEFCLKEGRCVPTGGCGGDSSPSMSICPFGQVFCAQAGSCTPMGMCGNPGSQTNDGSMCRSGEVFCMRTGTCTPLGMCGNPGSQTNGGTMCRSGEVFCMQTGTCTPLGMCGNPGAHASGDSMCRSGEVFCMQTGSCVPRGMCGNLGAHTNEGSVCRLGEVFCIQTGACVPKGTCGMGSSSPGLRPVPECSAGKILCLSSGECVYPGQCAEERELKSPLISCAHGEVFCMATGSCTPLNQCGTSSNTDKNFHHCPPGQVFCTVSGACEFAPVCGGSGNSGGMGGGGPAMELCPPNKVFCLSSGTCERAGGCQGGPPKNTICPRGYVYCLQRGECVSVSKGCDAESQKLISCPSGTVFSIQKGTCMADLSDGSELYDWLPDLQCPRADANSSVERATFSHSSCISNHHCPFGYSCCPDPETLHLQCVNNEGALAKDSLNMTCSVLGESRHDTGISCDEPEDCPVASVCCTGRCRSLKGVETCPPQTLYCSLTQSCIRVGESCEKVCQPGHVFCITSNECGLPNSCEFATSRGAPWTLPGPIILPVSADTRAEIPEDGVAFTEVYKTAASLSADPGNKFYQVMNMTTKYGTWLYKVSKRSSWVDMDLATILTPSYYIRYEPSLGTYDFGYENLNLWETDSDITRTIVQLLAPAEPKISLEVIRPKITTDEETAKMFYLTDLVNISMEDDLYWRAWWNSVDLPKDAAREGLLDFAHPAVVSWVTMLTRPGHHKGRKGKKGRGHGGGVRLPAGSVGAKGVRISLDAPMSLDETKANLAYSTDLGKTWETMNPHRSADIPLVSSEDISKTVIQFMPSYNAYGQVSFVISPFYADEDKKKNEGEPKKKKLGKNKKGRLPPNIGSDKMLPLHTNMVANSDEKTIILEIQPINDAPTPKMSANLNLLPALTPGKVNRGTLVQDYARIFYEDDDGDTLGLAILQAVGGSLGTWQYSLDDGNSYQDITGLTEDPLPRDTGLGSTHQGLVDLNSLRKQNECNIKSMIRNADMLASTTSKSGGSSCMTEAKRRMLKDSSSQPEEEEDAVVFDSSLIPGSGGSETGGSVPHEPVSRNTFRGKRNVGYSSDYTQILDNTDSVTDSAVNTNVKARRVKRIKRDVGQAQFDGFGTGRLNVSTIYPSVEAVCLPSNTLLRFNPRNNTYWDRVDALTQTRLVFTAWDMNELASGSNEVVMLNVSLHYCQEVGKCNHGSISWSPVVIAAEWSDCSGGKVSSGKPKAYDECGVCGGDSTSCLDCAGMLNGSATFECGMCIGGTTGKEAKRDCAGGCGEENVFNDQNICVPKSDPNITYCDNQPGSGAFINPCGVCVGGTTGLDKDYGKDQCGVCGGKNDCVGCDDKPNSGAEFDLCGQCLKPTDPQFNAGCTAMGNVKPLLLDAAIIPMAQGLNPENMPQELRSLLTLEAAVAGVDKKYAVDNCTLVSVSDDTEIYYASDVSYKKEHMRATFSSLAHGVFNLNCSFEAKRNKRNLQPLAIVSNDSIAVVDSSQMKIQLPAGLSEVDVSNDVDINVTVSDGKVTDVMACFLLYGKDTVNFNGKGNKGKAAAPWTVHELGTKVLGPSEVTCTIPQTAHPGDHKIGLAQTTGVLEMLKVSDLLVTTVPIKVKCASPEVVSAILNPTGDELEVTFDQNVDSSTDCSEIFTWPWANTQKQPSPKCKFKAATLSIRLGRGMKVSNGTMLNFTLNNGVRRLYGTTSNSPQASGSITVLQPEALDEIKFQLNGDTQACNQSDVKAIVSRIQGANVEDVKINWNITWEPGTANLPQSENLLMWESVREIKLQMEARKTKTGGTLTFPGNMLRPGREYLYIAQLEGPDGLMSEPQGITVTSLPAESALIVTIRGPTEISADRSYKYTAITTLCTEGDSLEDLNLEYMWNVEPEGAEWHDTIGQSVTLRKGILRGGKTYTITVEASDFGNPPIKGEGSLVVTTVSQGIEVITAADNIKVGSTSSVKLDASRSRDRDNNGGALRYRWSCLTEIGKACITQRDNRPIRLENLIEESKLKAPQLVLEAGVLQPGRYVFTVEVSKNEATGSKNVNVEVSPGELPILVTQRPGMVVDAQDRIIIKGWVTGQENIEVWWEAVEEPGFSYADISELSAGKKTTLTGLSNMREYDLVLPKPKSTRNWMGLEDGTIYKFRLRGRNKDGDDSFAEVDCRTNERPIAGKFEVTPTLGDALVTNFTFNASGWTDDPDDLPLTTSFGYRIKQTGGNAESPITWAVFTTSEVPTATIFLTADAQTSKVVPVIKVCDTYKACTVKEIDAINVKLPKSLPSEVPGILVDNFERLLRDEDSTAEALATFKAQLATLEAMGAEDTRAALTLFAETALQKKTSDLMNKLNVDPEATDSTRDFLSGAMNLLDDIKVSEDTIMNLLSLKRSFVSKVSGAPEMEYNDEAYSMAQSLPESSDDRVYFPSDDADQDAVRNAPLHRGGDTRGHRRSKRQATSGTTSTTTSDTSDTQELKPMTTNEVLAGLRTTEKALLSQDSQGAQTARMEELVNDLKVYMAGLCLGMSYQDIPRDVLSTLAGMRVMKSQLTFPSDDRLVLVNSKPNPRDFVEIDSFIKWGPVLEKYKEWKCGRKGDEGEPLNCYGACLGTALMKEDFLSPVAGSKPPGEMRSHIAESLMINTETGVEIPVENLEDKITYVMVLNKKDVPPGKSHKCFGWGDSEWDDKLCSTGNKFAENNVSKIRCFCRSSGYLGVFLVDGPVSSSESPEPTEEEVDTATTTSKPAVNTTNSRKVKFKIYEDYNTTVGEKKEEFEADLTKQLAVKLNVREYNIRNLTVSPGSILVEFDFVKDVTRFSGNSPDELYEKLSDLIGSGDLVLKGLKSEDLKVPSQKLDGSGAVESKPAQTMLPIIIGSVVGGVVLIVIVLICIAVYLKNKKRMDKIQPFQAQGAQQPTYSSIHFEQSLDGTAASLAKRRNNATPANRSLSSGGSYSDEGIFIERQSTAGSRPETRGEPSDDERKSVGAKSDGRKSVDSGTAEEVPAPFRYKPPTKEQLNRTGPIPDHILEQMKAEDEDFLPGTPAGLA